MAEPGVDPIDAYLAKLRKGLTGLPDCDDSVAEAEDHLRETVDAYVRVGMPAHEAAQTALRQFGSASLVSHAHVVDHRKGAAVATTFTRYAGLAGAALTPLVALAIASEAVDRSTTHWFWRSFPAYLLTAALFAFAFAFVGLAARHRHALGGWGRAARIVLVLAVPLSLPFGWGAFAALIAWLAIAATILALGMFSVGVLPRVPIGGLIAAPPAALAVVGIGTFLEYDMGQGVGSLAVALALGVVGLCISWLGLVMWREPAVDRRPTVGPFAPV